jgi:hypothetical protein
VTGTSESSSSAGSICTLGTTATVLASPLGMAAPACDQRLSGKASTAQLCSWTGRWPNRSMRRGGRVRRRCVGNAPRTQSAPGNAPAFTVRCAAHPPSLTIARPRRGAGITRHKKSSSFRSLSSERIESDPAPACITVYCPAAFDRPFQQVPQVALAEAVRLYGGGKVQPRVAYL